MHYSLDFAPIFTPGHADVASVGQTTDLFQEILHSELLRKLINIQKSAQSIAPKTSTGCLVSCISPETMKVSDADTAHTHLR